MIKMITFKNFVFDNKSHVAVVRLNDGQCVSLKDIWWEKYGEVDKGKLFEVLIFVDDEKLFEDQCYFFTSHNTPDEVDEILFRFQSK